MIYKKEYKEKNKDKRHFDKVPAEKSIDFRPEEANMDIGKAIWL